MSKVTLKNARVIKRVIDTLCISSGLNLNLSKSKVFVFSKTGGPSLTRAISDTLGFGQILNLGKILGCVSTTCATK